ncbi:hypothetical protein [Halovivax gelatinilyticus]|uniref:hypothetical protein n=1 Tax=Halovivax gelatinilyticus TaxID=2961597 RepID=UPI0020CA71BA|nr:hypothetical protein [Halovivax gelatinilyticus]
MTASPGRAALLAALAVGLLLAGGVAPSGATGATDAGEPAVASAIGLETDDDNETVRHRHPDEYADEADGDGLADWLEGALGDRLGDSAAHLSEGEYDLARAFVDEEFERLLEDYVDVADGSEREARAEQIEHASDEYDSLVDAMERYDEYHASYESLLDADETDRARETARELEALAAEINATSASIVDRYESMQAEDDLDLSETIDSIERTNERIQSEQASVRDRVFEETSLTVTTDAESISFLDPMTATGSLETVDGAPIANESIALAIGAQTIETATDDDGAFSVEYRPIAVPADADAIAIAYEPEPAAPYLESETETNVSIEPVTVPLETSVEPSTVAFGEAIDVTGTLSVDGVGVDDVSLSVTADGETIGTVDTEDGELVDGSIDVPASVASGEVTVTVSLPFEDRAVDADPTSHPITVEETETSLSLSTERDGARSVSVTGALEADGTGVADQSVQVRVDGTTVETVETDAEGAFETTVDFSPSEVDVTVSVTFDGTGTNLASATESATIETGAGGTGSSSALIWVGLAAGVGALLGGGWWYWRWRRAGGDGGDSRAGDSVDEPAGVRVDPTEDARVIGDSLLEDAESALSAGQPARAVERAYAATRVELAAEGADTGLTHWEFYDARRDATDDSTLRSVTEGYERATFDPSPVDEATARDVLAGARAISGRTEPKAVIADD